MRELSIHEIAAISGANWDPFSLYSTEPSILRATAFAAGGTLVGGLTSIYSNLSSPAIKDNMIIGALCGIAIGIAVEGIIGLYGLYKS